VATYRPVECCNVRSGSVICELCGRVILFGLAGLVDHYAYRHPITIERKKAA
jgi:hypothetical protein